jgi:hypothetical protein
VPRRRQRRPAETVPCMLVCSTRKLQYRESINVVPNGAAPASTTSEDTALHMPRRGPEFVKVLMTYDRCNHGHDRHRLGVGRLVFHKWGGVESKFAHVTI